MSSDFNEFIDNIADGIKQAIGPFGALVNPQSSRATQYEIDELKARVARQDRLLDTQLDTINEKARKLREAEGERDALREQLNALKTQPKLKRHDVPEP